MRVLWSYKMIYMRVNTGRCVTSALTGARMFPDRRLRRARARGGSGGGGGWLATGWLHAAKLQFQHRNSLLDVSGPCLHPPRPIHRWKALIEADIVVTITHFRHKVPWVPIIAPGS
jgi:hypothetical protein